MTFDPKWLDEAKEQEAKFIVVVCDCFDYEDFPVYCKTEYAKNVAVEEYSAMAMHRIMEVIEL